MSDSSQAGMLPPAVRVWRGFRLPELTLDEFCETLGAVFIPATVKMQIDVGLAAYIPTVLADLPGKPATVPDETALVFWESEQTYVDAFQTLAVRIYTLTHKGVYTMTPPESRADFPARFAGTLKADQPVFLFDEPRQWMDGPIVHLAGGRPPSSTPAKFRQDIAAVLAQIEREAALGGLLACAGDDYIVYWELGRASNEAGAPSASAGARLSNAASMIQSVVDWHQLFTPVPLRLTGELWHRWPGIEVRSGSSFNLQFEPRAASTRDGVDHAG